MRRAPFIAVTLLLCAGCAARTSSRASEAATTTAAAAAPTAAGATAAPTSVNETGLRQPEPNAEVPAEFREVDFRNFSYPAALNGKGVRLREGEYEQRYPDGSGGDTFDFRDVRFADITGDGKKEAIVQLLLVSCGASCDGGSHLFYFYSVKGGRPALLWRISTGSSAYECGLKSFILEKRKLTVEGFRECRYSNGFLGAQVSGKFAADEFTRFEFEFTGRGFALRKREVLPFPEGSTLNYWPTVSVSDE